MRKTLFIIILSIVGLLSPNCSGPAEANYLNKYSNKVLVNHEKEYLKSKFKNGLNKTLDEFNINDSIKRTGIIENYTKEPVIHKIIEITDNFDIKPIWLMKIIIKESAGSPDAVNPYSNATGIIQWMPKTAKYLGTSIKKLKKMNIFNQLDYVEKYLKFVTEYYPNSINNYEDLYLAIFYPKALGKRNNFIIGNKNKLVAQNRIIDYNKDSIITVKDFKQYALN